MPKDDSVHHKLLDEHGDKLNHETRSSIAVYAKDDSLRRNHKLYLMNDGHSDKN